MTPLRLAIDDMLHVQRQLKRTIALSRIANSQDFRDECVYAIWHHERAHRLATMQLAVRCEPANDARYVL